MPAFLGAIQIFNIAGTANVQFGDLAWHSPKTATKEAIGGSGGDTAAFNISNQLISVNNTLDTSVIEQPTVGNA
ncbi:spore germination protein [Bacillus sp. APMAM]|nr:spore germination protein [Bacillus sp. APMAM]RTZ57352.1 spore germination protein [Bacillus sp. SAJ1]